MFWPISEYIASPSNFQLSKDVVLIFLCNYFNNVISLHADAYSRVQNKFTSLFKGTFSGFIRL